MTSAASSYDWVAVEPDAANLTAAGMTATLSPSLAWKIKLPSVSGIGNAREVNDTLGIVTGTVVWLTFVGYTVPVNVGDGIPQGTRVDGADVGDVTPEDGSVPMYLFEYTPPLSYQAIPPHDHRDSFNGGFAFAVFHPGTAIPQQPWAV